MIIETIYNTESKILEVTADGKKMKNVADVVFMGFSDDNEFFMDITTIDRSKNEEGVTTRTSIMASEDGKIELHESILPNPSDLVTYPTQDDVKEGLAKAFS